MKSISLAEKLAALTGYLQSTSSEDKRIIEELQTSIAESVLEQDLDSIKSNDFIFEGSDLYQDISLKSERMKEISEVLKKSTLKTNLNNRNVFIRKTPIRSTQIAGSIDLQSAGARAKTLGPIKDIHGIPRFFDFIIVKKLIALYIQGQAKPAILFDASFKKSRFVLPGGKPIELTKNYTVIPETVWIQAKILAPGVPEDLYCGLRVKGGSISLNIEPTLQNNQVTVTNTTTISCDFELEQNNSFETDSGSPYGIDARNAVYDLPKQFRFTILNNTKNIGLIGDAALEVFGQTQKFKYQNNQNCVYNSFLKKLAIPIQSENTSFEILKSESPFYQLNGKAFIKNSWWGLPVNQLDIVNPLEADGNGALILETSDGISIHWKGLQNKNIALNNPFFLCEPGRIGFTEIKSNSAGAFQTFKGWKDTQNPFGTTLECHFNNNAILLFNTLANGNELIYTNSNINFLTDRPVKANGEAVKVKTKNSVLGIIANKVKSMLAIIDQDMLWDNKLPQDKIPKVRPYALAMHNALFTVTPPNNLILFSELNPDFNQLINGQMFLGFGLYSYLPSLPDPYAANLGILNRQFENDRKTKDSQVYIWLVSLVKWEKSDDTDDYSVGTSFHFAPLQTKLNIEKDNDKIVDGTKPLEKPKIKDNIFYKRLESINIERTAQENDEIDQASSNLGLRGNDKLGTFNTADFSLIDVSSKANQMGVAYSGYSKGIRGIIGKQFKVELQDEDNASVFPIQVSGLDVIAAGYNTQAFTVPAIAWEPVFNLTTPGPDPVDGEKDDDGVKVPFPRPKDPPVGFNYYQNDGIPTYIGNFSKNMVPLSPIPLSKFLVESYKNKEDGKTYALFNLPFGMLAVTLLNNNSAQSKKPKIDNPKPIFENYVNGGLQLELTAGTSFAPQDDSNMFEGFTFQLANINDAYGNPTNSSTLAGTPTQIFNNEFQTNASNLPARPGVPITGIGLSGYGASMVSQWHNKEALFAQTSKAEFNVVTGRTNHEVVQVKSMLYPWGIRVVRTITIFRLANGYVARVDSGWKAESDGKFDFSYNQPIVDSNGIVTGKTPIPNPFEFHPGVVRGLYNVRNIREMAKVLTLGVNVELRAVSLDADILLENITEGGKENFVTSKEILAYVQVAPAGKPISVNDFQEILENENNSIGGTINCIMKVAGTQQRMKINRFDLSYSWDAANNPIFVCAARGSVIMPKDGSWTMVQHNRGTGDVSPLPEQLSVPIVRVGKWIKDKVIDESYTNNLLRIANPADLLKIPDADTLNFGFLQNMGTQKVLFMTPGFKKGTESLLSKTPPLLADAFRLMNSKGIFPNIGDIESNFGQAISLLKGIDGANPLDAFNKINVPDVGDVFNVLQLKAKEEASKLLDQGYELAKGAINGVANKAIQFDLPSFDYPLINLDGKLVINIQYKASSKTDNKNYVGKFDFDVNSFANDLKDTWKGRLNNLALVVSIGPLKDVMTIKGNFNSQKGKATDIGSKSSDGFNLPTPEIEFSDALKPVIQILEILASLSSGEYGDALKKGLKVAMSNNANIWEYKFEASKDIPLVRFPPTKQLYESPQTPLKLEASMGLGISFNAALKVTTDPSQLLPTAGGYFKFHGGLQVMCMSVGAGSIFAIGEVDLKLEADTSPKVAVTMKFGFGAQICVGLPVIGNVSITFMVGVEVYADSSSVVKVTAMMMFRGHAEILGGIVGVTITIEAKGTVEKSDSNAPTNCKAQVSFALDISIFLIIDISFSESWEETRQIS